MPTAASTMTKVDAAVTPSELGAWLGLSEAQTLLGGGHDSSGKAKTTRRRRSSARGRRRTSLDDPTDAPGFGIDERALLLGCRIAATDPPRGGGGGGARGRASQEAERSTHGLQRAHSSPSRPAFHAHPPAGPPAGRPSTHGSGAGWDSEEESPYLRSVSRESHLSSSSTHGLVAPAVSHEQSAVGPTHGPAPNHRGGHDPQVAGEGNNLQYLASFHRPSLLTAMERSRTTAPRSIPSRRIAALVRKSDATRGMLLHALGTPSGLTPSIRVGAPPVGKDGARARPVGTASPYGQHRRDSRRASAPESPTKVAQRNTPFPSYAHHFFRNKRLSMDAMRPRMGGWKGDAKGLGLGKADQVDVHEGTVPRSAGRWMPTPKPPPEGEDAVQAELRRIALEMGVQ